MDLDSTGWPELPAVGSVIRFHSGEIVLQVMGKCTVVRADHVRNAAGKPAGRITLHLESGEVVQVTLSQVRAHAELIQDGLDIFEFERAMKIAALLG